MFKETNIFSGSRLALALILALMIAIPFATPASAGEILPGDPDVYIGPDEVIDDDLFVSGRFIQIDGTVRGDVFAAGQEITINGLIEGNLFTAGQLHMINGQVDGSVFAVGFSIEYGPEAIVGGSSFVGAYSLLAAEGSQITRNLYLGGYQANLAGDIGRDVIASLSAFKLEGSVAGDVLLELNEARDSSVNPNDFTFYFPGNVEVLPEGIDQVAGSFIGGQLDYSVNQIQIDIPFLYGNSNTNINIADDLVGAYFANWIITRVGEFVALLIIGALFFNYMPKTSGNALAEFEKQPFANMGWGLLVALLIPLTLVLAIAFVVMLAVIGGILTLGQLAGTILSIGGLGVGALWVFFGLVFWLVSKTVFAYFVGQKLLERIRPETLDGSWAIVVILAVGLLIYEILRAIPLFGWIAALLVILAGVGSLYQVIRAALLARRAA